MEVSAEDRLWPSVPPESMYRDLRLPGTFRSLVASRNRTNEEIGRIVRCIALDTDFFMTPEIEPDVFFYRQDQNKKMAARERKRMSRWRLRTGADGEVIDSNLQKNAKRVTVTKPTKVANAADLAPVPLSLYEKTPSNLKEKTPPIVPLKRTPPSSLEKIHSHGVSVSRQGPQPKGREEVAMDLFALAATDPYSSASAETPKNAPQTLPSTLDDKVIAQDVEMVSRGSNWPSGAIQPGTDGRSDAAWVPHRFEVFWERYPRKVAKQAALKAFTKIIKAQPDVEKFMKTLLASVDMWKGNRQWTKDGGRFIPHPATWLNRGSWEDVKYSGKEEGQSGAQYLGTDAESEADLLRRMTGG